MQHIEPQPTPIPSTLDMRCYSDMLLQIGDGTTSTYFNQRHEMEAGGDYADGELNYIAAYNPGVTLKADAAFKLGGTMISEYPEASKHILSQKQQTIAKKLASTCVAKNGSDDGESLPNEHEMMPKGIAAPGAHMAKLENEPVVGSENLTSIATALSNVGEQPSYETKPQGFANSIQVKEQISQHIIEQKIQQTEDEQIEDISELGGFKGKLYTYTLPKVDETPLPQEGYLESMIPVADRLASPEWYDRGWVERAPLMKDIVANREELQKREAYPYLALRGDSEMGASTHDDDLYQYLQKKGIPFERPFKFVDDTTEADVLFDLYSKLLGIEKYDHLPALDVGNFIALARAMREKLYFIGEPEMQQAADGIARYWIDRLTSQPNLHVMADSDGSGGYIFNRVMAALEKHDPDGTLRKKIVHHRHAADVAQHKSIVNNFGLIVVDDWIISGGQMNNEISDLTLRGINPRAVEVNYICASDVHVTKDIKGAKVRAYYVRPHTNSNSTWASEPSLFGSHCSPDWGFTTGIGGIFNGIAAAARHHAEVAPVWPIAYRVSKPYRLRDSAGFSTVMMRKPDNLKQLGLAPK